MGRKKSKPKEQAQARPQYPPWLDNSQERRALDTLTASGCDREWIVSHLDRLVKWWPPSKERPVPNAHERRRLRQVAGFLERDAEALGDVMADPGPMSWYHRGIAESSAIERFGINRDPLTDRELALLPERMRAASRFLRKASSEPSRWRRVNMVQSKLTLILDYVKAHSGRPHYRQVSDLAHARLRAVLPASGDNSTTPDALQALDRRRRR